MGHKVAGPGNEIGVASPSNLHARDEFSDIFEVHLGLKDANDIAGKTLDGNRKGHIRFRTPHKINRTKIGFSLFGLLERR
jgi:hypothetical protein